MLRFLTSVLLITQALTAAPEWLYKASCEYQADHDMARVDLAGYDPLYLDNVAYCSRFDGDDLFPDSLKYEDVSKWKPGRSVSIAYASETGAVLLDPATGKYCEITSGLTQHPLDLLREEYIGEGSTASVVVGTSKVIDLWKKEIARIYDRLRYEFPEQVAELDQAQESWEAFYAAQLKVLGIVNDKGGSIYSLAYAQEHLKLVSDYAKGLAGWGRY